MKSRRAILLAQMLLIMTGRVYGQTQHDTGAIDRAVISKVWSQFQIHSKVVRRVDLTQPFHTRSQWSLLVAKQPDAESSAVDGAGNQIGAVSVCFVQNSRPDCSEKLFEKEKPFNSGDSTPRFYELFASEVVFSGPEKTLPLLKIKTCSTRGANGNCVVFTFLIDYDRKADRFRVVFSNSTSRNNNQETRFVENGPLLGSIIVVDPTNNAPFTYFVEVYQRVSGADYSRVLKYRGRTGYGDGNLLAVIDSEMPQILSRLGFWKPGDALPVPPHMPAGCKRLVMRKGVEWCE